MGLNYKFKLIVVLALCFNSASGFAFEKNVMNSGTSLNEKAVEIKSEPNVTSDTEPKSNTEVPVEKAQTKLGSSGVNIFTIVIIYAVAVVLLLKLLCTKKAHRGPKFISGT